MPVSSRAKLVAVPSPERAVKASDPCLKGWLWHWLHTHPSFLPCQVGRTKIITVHSGIWLKNSTDRRLRFRLHVPITSLVAPAGQDVGGHQHLASDVSIGPLQPDAGTGQTQGQWRDPGQHWTLVETL